MKNYNKAPLPFQGQKRNFLKKFREELKKYPGDVIYIDLFGGTGLLSHTIKSIHPEARVIYNDFDSYAVRLQNIDKTNVIISDIRNIIGDMPQKQRMPDDIKQEILSRLKLETGFVDYITISSSLLFSGNYAASFDELAKSTFYNRIVNTEFNANGYLEDVERISMDYKKLFEMFKDHANVVFILDPPYLSTDTSTYNKMTYWSLATYLDILKTIENRSFFYFTSEKSQLPELMQWLDENNYYQSPFAGAHISTVQNGINYSTSYQDIMIHKKVC